MGIRGKTYSYEYDVNGLRTRKTNSDGGYTEYYIMDGLTVAERRFDSTNTEVYTMRYYFDESNAPIGIGIQYPSSADTYWENYYFAKNLQGDIIAIYNNNGGEPNLIATYEYDAWGKPLSIRNASGVEIAPNAYHVGLLNPFRYRGYRYDADTGFYYLQSRYYDPVIGRFINADGLASTGQGFIGYNMFAYCNNNPVNCSDPTGHAAGWTNTYYDQGGGYYLGIYQPEPGTDEADLLEEHMPKQVRHWGGRIPDKAVVVCYKLSEEYVRKNWQELADDIALGVIGGGIGAVTIPILFKSAKKGVPFLAGLAVELTIDKILESVLSNHLDPANYELYVVRSAERYRMTDPTTGEFCGWQDAVSTTYYVKNTRGTGYTWTQLYFYDFYG